jgi:hypothetical protein
MKKGWVRSTDIIQSYLCWQEETVYLE